MNDRIDDTFATLILAAGFGTRLAPMTDHVPKPLLPVGGVTLLDHAIAAVDRAGAGPVVVNTHHKANLIAEHLRARPDYERFHISHEPEILGTGGALHGARRHLADHAWFVIHNADVLCDASLEDLIAEHERTGAAATLLLTDWPPINSVTVADGGVVLSLGGDEGVDRQHRRLTYTGISVIGAEVLADIGPGYSSLIDPLKRAVETDRGSVHGYAPDGLQWSDLGSLGRWLAAQGPHPSPHRGPLSMAELTGHGSDRRFWRLSVPAWSAVAMLTGPDDEEFGRAADIAGYLHARKLGGARVLARDETGPALLLEDLGADSLYDLVQAGDTDAPAAYRAAVDRLLALQADTAHAREKCPAATDRCLDEKALRRETVYFRDRFLNDHLGLSAAELSGLDAEFDALARAVARQPRVLMHRDFQSRNLVVNDGEVRLVDVQGMRLGPAGYDIMSLVHDPYVALTDDLRAELLDRWYRQAAASGPLAEHLESDLLAMATAAGLQRIMQALGAYGYLGRVKRKLSFLDHVPRALERLRFLLAEARALIREDTDSVVWLPDTLAELSAVADHCADGTRHRPLDEGPPDR